MRRSEFLSEILIRSVKFHATENVIKNRLNEFQLYYNTNAFNSEQLNAFELNPEEKFWPLLSYVM